MRTAVVLLSLLSVAAGAMTVQQFINDNNVMNYALTLENFEAALYAAGAGFTDAQYAAAGYPAGTKAAIDYIGSIEAGHAVLINNTLAARGWPAVPACNGAYNFGFNNNVTQFVNLLGIVEAAGTAAYDGAATAITDKNLLTLAAGIATIEARHTAILYTIINGGNGGSFTPGLNSNAQTPATSFDQTLTVVTPFFTAATGGFINCPTATQNTVYNGTVTVGSTLFSSYRWATANSLRGLSEDLTGFYGALNNATVSTNDLSILQYALALENFEATFYKNYSSLYSVAAIQASYPSVSTANATLISNNFALIGQHEALHASYLTGVLNAFQQTPGTPCNYTVPLTSTSTFADFIALSATIENVGVGAYVGAISFIANSQLSTAAAAIATVEGNHAAYVANLVANNGISFTPLPNTQGVAQGAADSPVTPSVVLATQVAPFIAQCTDAQLGTPSPINSANFVNFFNDQDRALGSPFPGTFPTTTTVSTSNGARTTTAQATSTVTRPSGSASGLTVAVAVVIAAICAAL